MIVTEKESTAIKAQLDGLGEALIHRGFDTDVCPMDVVEDYYGAIGVVHSIHHYIGYDGKEDGMDITIRRGK